MYLSLCILKKYAFRIDCSILFVRLLVYHHTTDEDRLTEEYILVLKCIKKKYPQNASSLTIHKKETTVKFSVEKREKKLSLNSGYLKVFCLLLM